MELRSEIARSWQRAAATGLDPGADPDTSDPGEYDPASRLRRAAAPVLDLVAGHLDGSRYALILADRDSTLVDVRFGVPDLESRLESVGAVPGKCFTEATTGTNSIATAAEMHRGISVHGEEHYLESFKRFACYGLPIRDPVTGRHAGVLDITCLAEDAAPLLRPFLLRAAHDVEASLLENARESHRRILVAFEAANTRSRRPLVAFGPDLVLTNDAAADLLEPLDHAALQAMGRSRARDGRCTITLASGATMTAEIDHVHGGGTLVRFEPPESRPPIPRRPAPTAARSADWAHDLTPEIDRCRAQGVSVLVRGEPGTGRTTTAHRLVDPGTAVVLGCPVSPDDVERALRRLAAGSSRPVLVLDDIDLLAAEAAAVVARLVDRYDARVVLTTGVDAEGGGPDALGTRCPVTIVTTPLHAARERIPALAAAIVSQRTGGEIRFAPAALRMLAEYDWPGNLRELGALVDHVRAHRSAGDVTVADLPARYREQHGGHAVPGALRRAERAAIVRALIRAGGNKAQAARELGIARNTVYRRIRELGIDENALRPGG